MIRKILTYWLPPLLWLGLIFYFSTDNFSGQHTGSILQMVLNFFLPDLTVAQFDLIHFYLRKAAHLTEYAILAFLLFRAFRAGAVEKWRWSWAICTLSIVAGYALLDEYHQSFTGQRVGTIYDSLIDTAGGLAALIFLGWRRLRDKNQLSVGST